MTVALVTTFNEAATIGPLVASLREKVDRVLVVDDPATTDNTEQIAAAMGAETLVDTTAFGIGPCLLAGLRYLKGEKVVVVDAGGSHDAAAIFHMVRRLDHADVVIGSRFIPGSKYDGRPLRSLSSRLFAKACNRRFGHKIADWTSGYRAYSPKAINAILARPPRAKMHGFQPQALLACLDADCRVTEYPITYVAGRSSLDTDAAREAVTWLVGLRCL